MKCCWLDEPPPPPPKPRAEELFEGYAAAVERVYAFLDHRGRHPDAKAVRDRLDDFQERFDAGEPGGIPDSQHVCEALFDFTTKGGKTLGELYLERKGAKLDAALQRNIAALCASYPAFYELLERRPAEQDKILREIGTDTHWRIREVDDPHAEVGDAGEIWLTRLVGTPDEAVCVMQPLNYPPDTAAAHAEIVNQLTAPFTAAGLAPADALREAMKSAGELLAECIVETSPVADDTADDDQDEDKINDD